MFPDAFLAHHAAHLDFSKAAKFGVLIFQPSGLIAGGLFGGLLGQTKATQFLMKPLNTAGLAFQCEQAILPGYNLNTVDQKIFGAPWSIAAQSGDYSPLELSFISAGDLWERKFFDDWMEHILPKGSKRTTVESMVNASGVARPAGTVEYRDNYISTIQVISFHKTGVPNIRYTFEECFPVQVAAQQLSWDNQNEGSLLRMTVMFHYRTWNKEKNLIQQVWEAFKTRGGEILVDDMAGGGGEFSLGQVPRF
jgi:hypothetical protein